MRRGLASLITGLSLLVATFSWAGFTLSRTVLDPGRSEALAEQLLDNPQVRDALVTRLAESVEPQLPPEVPVSRSLIEAGAETALDDPRVRALILDGVVQYHRNALEGNTEPVVIDANALGVSTRESLVAVRPELDAFLPAAPEVQVELPTTGLNWLSTLKRIVDRFTTLAALVALAGATIALVVARDRGAVLRRVAFWGLGAAAFWLVVGFAIPWLGDLSSPTSGAIASAAVHVFFGAMIRPAVVLAVASAILLLIGFALPAAGRQRGARVLQPTGVPAGVHPVGPAPAAPPLVSPSNRVPMPAARPVTSPPAPLPPVPSPPITASPAPSPPATASPATSPSPAATQRFAPPPAHPSPAPGTPVDRTTQMPLPSAQRPAEPEPDDVETRRFTTPGWEEGVGYLDERPPEENQGSSRLF
jgi:hypothetical protein